MIAIGGFDIVTIHEVRSRPEGFFKDKDLPRTFKYDKNMKNCYFVSDYIGQGFVPEVIAFMYRPYEIKNKWIDEKRFELIKI